MYVHMHTITTYNILAVRCRCFTTQPPHAHSAPTRAHSTTPRCPRTSRKPPTSTPTSDTPPARLRTRHTQSHDSRQRSRPNRLTTRPLRRRGTEPAVAFPPCGQGSRARVAPPLRCVRGWCCVTPCVAPEGRELGGGSQVELPPRASKPPQTPTVHPTASCFFLS